MSIVAATTAAVFIARDLTKVYHMGEVDVHALRGVDLDLFEGEFAVLLGPSGSGKSTLLNIIGGLDVPTGGSVQLPRSGSHQRTTMRRSRSYRRQARRVCVSVLQPDPEPNRARERRADHRNLAKTP